MNRSSSFQERPWCDWCAPRPRLLVRISAATPSSGASPCQLASDKPTVPVATPGALFAMKLHAIEDRRSGGGIDKRAGDAWDIYRILLDLDRDGTVREELVAFPLPLRRVVADTAERILVDRATRTISWLKAGDERMAAVTAGELQALGGPVVIALRSD